MYPVMPLAMMGRHGDGRKTGAGPSKEWARQTSTPKDWMRQSNSPKDWARQNTGPKDWAGRTSTPKDWVRQNKPKEWMRQSCTNASKDWPRQTSTRDWLHQNATNSGTNWTPPPPAANTSPHKGSVSPDKASPSTHWTRQAGTSSATDKARPPVGGGVWRVRAAVTVPAGITIGPYPSEILLGTNTTDLPGEHKYIQVKVEDGTLVACSDEEAPADWLLHVTPARDRHEQNVEALRDARGMVVFRIIKEIPRHQELMVWYSAELAMECNIPILTPANIRGNQEYACTFCDASFRYPNTLKAHVRFHCARSTMTSWLGQYTSLHGGSLLTAYQQELAKYFTQLSTIWSLRKLAPPEYMSKMASGDLSPRCSQSEGVKSAFRPCTTAASNADSDKASVFAPSQSPLMSRHKMGDNEDRSHGAHGKTIVNEHSVRPGNSSPLMSPLPGMTSLPNYMDKLYMYNYAQCLRSRLPGCSPDLGASARLPLAPGTSFIPSMSRGHCGVTTQISPSSVVSHHGSRSRHEEDRSPSSERDSPPKLPVGPITFPMPSETAGEPIDLLPKSLYMSKAYKGHLCIYCGKLYSRKYGLKIHLRTHTGYKPLKCKVCLRPFGDPSNLNKHIRLHAEGDTPYRCQYCCKVLVRRRDLERHIKSRHPAHSECVTSLDYQSDDMADTDNSFIDVGADDEDDDDDEDDCESPLDMTRQDIEVT